ncbi:MAG: sigma-70 family RNA polymerase sigma factor, partial [Lachnospiraceae bacterium]
MGGGKVMEADERMLRAVEQMKKGEEEGFNTLYAQTCRFVYARARQATNDEQEALDLMQEVYLAAYRSIGHLKNTESLYSWLASITMRQGAKMTNKRKHQVLLSEEKKELFEEIPDSAPAAEDTMVEKETAGILKKMIESLPKAQRSAVVAYYYDRMKVEEIARETDTSTGTIKKRLYLARKQLKEAVSQWEKRENCVLHGFSGASLVFAIHLVLEDTTLSQAAAQSIYQNICGQLGIQGTQIILTKEKVADRIQKIAKKQTKGQGKANMNELFNKLMELGKVKLVSIAVGTVAVVGAGTAAGIYVHGQNQAQEAQVQAEEQKENQEELAKKQEAFDFSRMTARSKALRTQLSEVIITDAEYQTMDQELKKIEQAVKDKKVEKDMDTTLTSLDKTMSAYVQKSSEYLLQKENPLSMTDVSAWEEGRLNGFRTLKSEYDLLKSTLCFKTAETKLDVLLTELAKGETGTLVAENTETGTADGIGNGTKPNQTSNGTKTNQTSNGTKPNGTSNGTKPNGTSNGTKPNG